MIKRILFITGILLIYVLGVGTGMILDSKENKVAITPVTAVSPTPSCSRTEISYDSVLLTLNEYRLQRNLPQLRTTALTTAYADLRQSELAGRPLTHESVYSDVVEYAKRNGVSFLSGGELLQEGFRTPCDSLQGFLASPTHTDILGKGELDTVGLSVAENRIIIELADNPNY